MYSIDDVAKTDKDIAALGCSMDTFLRYFPAAETMYQIFLALEVAQRIYFPYPPSIHIEPRERDSPIVEHAPKRP